ncbi:MAG: hypothetical protein U1F67_10300 [Rubrivivax sp.]
MGHAGLSPAPAGSWRAGAATASAAVLAGVWAAELGHLVLRSAVLSAAARAGLVLFLGLALLRASGHIRWLFVAVCGVAVGLSVWQGHADALREGLRQVQVFGAFLPSVLMMRATVQASPRSQRLQQGMQALTALQARHWTLVGCAGLGSVLNVGAMAMLAPVVARGADEATRAELAGCAAKGVGAAIMWSPFFVAMAFTSQLVPGVPLWQAMATGGGLAVLALALAQALFIPGLRARDAQRSVRALGPLAAPMVVVIGGVLVLVALGFTGLQAVALWLPLACGAYLVRAGAGATGAAARSTFAHFARLSDELLIIVGAQLMGIAVAAVPEVRQWAQELLPTLVSGAPLLVLMVAVLVALGQLGLHPMIGVGLAVPIVAAGPFGIAPVVIVVAGVFAWALSASVAIWTLPVAVAATTFGVPAPRLLTRRSVAFGVLLWAAGCAYLAALNAWLMR